jgi:hypothetical protein
MATCGMTGRSKSCKRSMHGLASLPVIVDDYIHHYRARATEELTFYTSITSLSEVIKVAANALTAKGKRHDHQRRIPGGALARFGRALLTIEGAINNVKSFSDLHQIIKEAASDLRHIGRLGKTKGSGVFSRSSRREGRGMCA